MKHLSTFLLILWLLSVSSPARAQPKPRVTDASDSFFDQGQIPKLTIQVSEAELAKLKSEPRTYVHATLRENDSTTYKDVAIKLKGAAGSYREWDDRPALTLNAGKFNKSGSFHDLVKFHLNNSVQDESYVSEWICSEVFRKAGVPTPHVTHARVWLNDRDVGLYVLKEGFDAKFLKRHFADPTGNLYDGGFVQDLDAELEKDEGSGPNDRSDLKAIVEAVQAEDPQERCRKLESLIDLDAFLTFMALERMTCHWDGYTSNTNNYRVYFEPKGKAVFLPHGMDQMFAETGMGLFDHTKPMLASAAMQNNAWRKRYRERIEKLLPIFSPVEPLQHRVDELQKRLHPVLTAMDADAAAAQAEKVKEFKDHLAARAENLRTQLAEPEPGVQGFDEQGIAALDDWHEASETEDAKLERVKLADKKETYHIACGATSPCVASWRRHVLLAAGTYRLQASVRTSKVTGPEGNDAGGAGAGISGVERTNHLRGTSSWKPLECEFSVREDQRQVELVLELRAKAGKAWFDVESLRLVRVRAP